LKGVHFLNYRDSGMPGSPDNVHPQALAAQPLEDVAANVVCYIRQLRPQVVLTFDPIGGYYHPDHIAIQRATQRAFELSANPAFAPECQPVFLPERLYFHILPRGFMKLSVKLLPLFGRNPRRFGANGDIDLVAIAAVDFQTHAHINIHSVLGKKERAGACHASQGGGRRGGNLVGFFMRMFSGTESFMRAYPPFMQGEKVTRDLFS
jgi:LmbE family N-acetylglucosaminyl deacetylase